MLKQLVFLYPLLTLIEAYKYFQFAEFLRCRKNNTFRLSEQHI
jgi:hypothetical protein